MIKIFNSLNIDRNGVAQLWEHSFGDTREYIDFFLDNCPGYLCFACYKDNRIVSLFFLLDGQLAGEKSKYLYAACTHTDYRRRGLMEELINTAIRYCEDKGYSSIFLVPANQRLYTYYSKFGFIDSFKKILVKFSTKNLRAEKFTDSFDISDIIKQKKRLLSSVDGFLFNDDVMEYTVKEHIKNGGKILSCNDSDGELLSFFYLDDNKCFVKELLTDYLDIESVLSKHFSGNNAEDIYISAPIVYNSKDILAEYTKCGMCLPINDRLKNYLKMHTELYASMYLD